LDEPGSKIVPDTRRPVVARLVVHTAQFQRRHALREIPAVRIPDSLSAIAEIVPLPCGTGALSSLRDANLFIDPRIVSGPKIRKHAAALATGNLELVVAGALPFALEIRRANPAMRMVPTCPGMISNGFAKTLDHPGGNVTGLKNCRPA
jgi:hypothetical protein